MLSWKPSWPGNWNMIEITKKIAHQYYYEFNYRINYFNYCTSDLALPNLWHR